MKREFASKKMFFAFAVGLLAVCFASAASAKDDITTTATTVSGPSPVIVNNGAAGGTIHVRYTHIGFTFPAPGVFATVQLDLEAQDGNGPPSDYGSNGITLNLNQDQEGLEHLVITPNPASFTVNNVNWSDSSTVTVEVPSGVTFSNDDGTTVNGVLQMATVPKEALRTVTTVIFFITLVHPTSCLKVYDFITQWEGEDELTSVVVRLDPVKDRGDIVGYTIHDTQPGLLSDNVLIVNTCSSTESFDLNVDMDGSFSLNPTGNPGNAVFTYIVEGSQTPATFDLSVFTDETGEGQDLCLRNRSLDAGDMLLLTAKMKIGITDPDDLPEDPDQFEFAAEVLEATLAPTTACSGAPHSLADPNPATTSLPYTTCTMGPGGTCQ